MTFARKPFLGYHYAETKAAPHNPPPSRTACTSIHNSAHSAASTLGTTDHWAARQRNGNGTGVCLDGKGSKPHRQQRAKVLHRRSPLSFWHYYFLRREGIIIVRRRIRVGFELESSITAAEAVESGLSLAPRTRLGSTRSCLTWILALVVAM
ncbi:hypothetical protein Salat_0017400 [Sesamum alatum]|uniref:Uncharacterized protein n=1 Tax=Sesamum alatum TaxID=300844 RepID=A0AAE2CW99_9LAMI|nr:hypothetical protein Salat_0017400 [Sesamum alatum]